MLKADRDLPAMGRRRVAAQVSVEVKVRLRTIKRK